MLGGKAGMFMESKQCQAHLAIMQQEKIVTLIALLLIYVNSDDDVLTVCRVLSSCALRSYLVSVCICTLIICKGVGRIFPGDGSHGTKGTLPSHF